MKYIFTLIFLWLGVVGYCQSIDEADKFMSNNKTKPSIVVVENGLQYEILKKSTISNKPSIESDDEVTISYIGFLADGTVFMDGTDKYSIPTFRLSKCIYGFKKGLSLMNIGDKYRLYIHPDLGYGSISTSKIPPFSVLVFEIQLLGINGKGISKSEGEDIKTLPSSNSDTYDRIVFRNTNLYNRDIQTQLPGNNTGISNVGNKSCIELINQKINIGSIEFTKYKPFSIKLKNSSKEVIQVERIESNGLVEFKNLDNRKTEKCRIAIGETFELDCIFYPKKYLGVVKDKITINFENTGCKIEEIEISTFSYDTKQLKEAITANNPVMVEKLLIDGTPEIEDLEISDIEKISHLKISNNDITKYIILTMQNCRSFDNLIRFDRSNINIRDSFDKKLIEFGTRHDIVLKIVNDYPDLKPNFIDKLYEYSTNFRLCEEVIWKFPEWKSKYESKMSNFVSNSNELGRFMDYFPNSVFKAKLIQKISDNPNSFEDVVFLIMTDSNIKHRMESKAFELLPKYASSEQCRQFITLYPNSTYKGMVEAQYQAALMDERVNKTMDEKLRQQEQQQKQSQPKDDRCYSCGGRGVCLECNGRGTKACDYHDTDGDGNCTTCDDRGYLVCTKCDGKGTCSPCGGKGRRN